MDDDDQFPEDVGVRLRPGVLLLDSAPDVVQVGLGRDAFRIRGGGINGPSLRAALRGGNTMDDLRLLLPSEVLVELNDRGFLEACYRKSPAQAVSDERWSRLAAFLGRTSCAPDTGSTLVQNLRQKTIAILGLGAGGSSLALGFASSAVGHLVLVDPAEIDLPDLNRQLYAEEDVGQRKVAVAAARLQRWRPKTQVSGVATAVRSEGDVAAVVSRTVVPDLVVLTADEPPVEVRAAVNAWCVHHRVPYVFLGTRERDVQAGPLLVPGSTGCFECWVAQRQRTEGPETKPSDAAYARATAEYGRPSCIGPAWIAAGFVLTDVVRLLSAGLSSDLWLLGRSITWSVGYPEPSFEAYRKGDSCTLGCGGGRGC